MLWNVKPDSVERTTLKIESVERRWGTGRGYCVEAATATDARHIVRDYGFTLRGYDIDRPVVVMDRQKVIVLCRPS